MLQSYAFSKTATPTPPNILGDKTITEFLKSKYDKGCIFGLDNLYKGYYKYFGWCFDFNPFLKTYLVKQYNSWAEYKAPNKTLLRRSIYGKIDRIVEA